MTMNETETESFLSKWDGALLGVGALRRLRTLCIGSGGTGETCLYPGLKAVFRTMDHAQLLITIIYTKHI